MTNCCSRFFSAASTIQGYRLVQSWPRRVKTLTASLEVDLHAVAVELDFVNPYLAGWHAVALTPSASGFFRWKAMATPGED